MPSWLNDMREGMANLDMRVQCLMVPLIIAAFVGCSSISVSYEFESSPPAVSPCGRYDLSGVDIKLATALCKYAPTNTFFTHGRDASAMPLKIHVLEGERRDATSAMHILPCALSLVILPGCFETHRDYKICIEGPDRQSEIPIRQIEREMFSVLPLGWIPGKFPVDGYDYALLVGNNNMLDREWEEAKTAVRRESLENIVTKVVLSVLTQTRYYSYKEWKSKKEKADEVVRIRAAARDREKVLRQTETGWRNETKLRELVLKEMPEIWDTIVERRVRVSEQRANLIRLRRLMMESGEVPENDAQYVAGRLKYDDERTVLVNIFRIIEKVWYEVSKNELYGNVEARVKRHQMIEQCVREIIAIEKKVTEGKKRP